MDNYLKRIWGFYNMALLQRIDPKRVLIDADSVYVVLNATDEIVNNKPSCQALHCLSSIKCCFSHLPFSFSFQLPSNIRFRDNGPADNQIQSNLSSSNIFGTM